MFQSVDTIFFNPSHGSSFQFVDTEINFQKINFCTKISTIKEKDGGVFDVVGKIKWIGENKETVTGTCRECILADNTGDICLTIWKESMISKIEEDVTYRITFLQIKNYFGAKLSTSGKSSMEKLSQKFEIKWPSVSAYLDNEGAQGRELKTINKAELCGILITAKTLCPGEECRSVITDTNTKITKCLKCNRKVVVSKCSIDLTGTVDLLPDISLKFDYTQIDALFGQGTSNLYLNKISQLEEKMLELENIDITYDVKQHTIKSMSISKKPKLD